MARDQAPPDPEIARAQIEKEHAELFRLTNEIKDALEASDNKAVGGALEDFKCLVRMHFRHEEEFMQDHKYPHIEDHKSKHDSLLRILEGLDWQPGQESLQVNLKLLNHLTCELQHFWT